MSLSGIKVGSILTLNIDPETYVVEVTKIIDGKIKLPPDTMAVVSAEGILGGNYVRLDPGGKEDDLVGPGGRLIYTQDAPDIIGLFSQMIYSPRENN